MIRPFRFVKEGSFEMMSIVTLKNVCQFGPAILNSFSKQIYTRRSKKDLERKHLYLEITEKMILKINPILHTIHIRRYGGKR